MLKKITVLLFSAMLVVMLSACADGKTLKIENVNTSANTFDFVDTISGEKIVYDRLILDGEDVVDFQCTASFSSSVVFATEEGQIVREGNKITYNGKAYTTAAELKYTLEDGTLSITGTED